MTANVDDYVAAIGEQLRPVAEAVRRIITEELPHAEEGFMWSRPTYKIDGHHVCYITASKAHVTLGFTEGRSLDDPDGALEGSGSRMAHVKLRSVDDIDEQRLRDWLRQAAEIARRS